MATEHDSIPAIVEGDATLLPGVVAMAHAFGGLVDEDHRYDELGSNTGRLIRTEVDYDPITGMPRMGNIPVAITQLTLTKTIFSVHGITCHQCSDPLTNRIAPELN